MKAGRLLTLFVWAFLIFAFLYYSVFISQSLYFHKLETRQEITAEKIAMIRYQQRLTKLRGWLIKEKMINPHTFSVLKRDKRGYWQFNEITKEWAFLKRETL